MSDYRKERILSQLGVPLGTAWGRMRKEVLFKYIVKAGDNFCFRCNEEIQTAFELSFEHKEPWENRNPELFWDLDNIAFSHKSCNLPHLQNNGAERQRLIGPKGTAWCVTCKEFLPIEQFHKNASRWNGLQHHCKECHKVHKGRVKV